MYECPRGARGHAPRAYSLSPCSMRFDLVRASALAITLVGLAAACRRSPRVRYVEFESMPIVTGELAPPPCRPGARPGSLEHRRASTLTSDSPTGTRLVIRVLRADIDTAIESAAVGVDVRRAMPTPAAGVFALDSLSTGRHGIRVYAIGFVALRDSLAVRAGYTDTLVAHLALWCR